MAQSRMSGSVLLVGSIPGDDAAEVLGSCGPGVGSYVTGLPDGETGYRRMWIHFLAVKLFHGHPALETVQRPQPVAGQERWHADDYREENWLRPNTPIKTFAGYGRRASFRPGCASRSPYRSPRVRSACGSRMHTITT